MYRRVGFGGGQGNCGIDSSGADVSAEVGDGGGGGSAAGDGSVGGTPESTLTISFGGGWEVVWASCLVPHPPHPSVKGVNSRPTTRMAHHDLSQLEFSLDTRMRGPSSSLQPNVVELVDRPRSES